MATWKRLISDFKDFMVKDNFGMHLLACYMLTTILGVWITILIAIGIEFYDKHILKTQFSWKDILADGIGIVLAILVMLFIL